MNFFHLVKEKDESVHIDYGLKAAELINSMWTTRDELHRRVYQHRVARTMDLMVCDLFMLMKNVTIPGHPDTPLCKAHTNMDAYIYLTDNSVMHMAEMVWHSKPDNVDYEAVHALHTRLRKRDLWLTLATVTVYNMGTDLCTANSKAFSDKFSDCHIISTMCKFKDRVTYHIIYKGPGTGEALNCDKFQMELLAASSVFNDPIIKIR